MHLGKYCVQMEYTKNLPPQKNLLILWFFFFSSSFSCTGFDEVKILICFPLWPAYHCLAGRIKAKDTGWVSQWLSYLPASLKSQSVLQNMANHFINVSHEEDGEGESEWFSGNSL
jgi:hypothetical protein